MSIARTNVHSTATVNRAAEPSRFAATSTPYVTVDNADAEEPIETVFS